MNPKGAGIWWLASYPKSGNTWVRAIVATLLFGKPADINALHLLGPAADSRSAVDDAIAIRTADLDPAAETNLRPRACAVWADEARRPLYCKAHDACHLTPSGEPLFPTAATRGAVYIVRDPRAVAVSLAGHLGVSLDAAIALMDNPAACLSGSPRELAQTLPVRLRRWSDHVESWLGAPFPVRVIRFEDLLAEPYATVTTLAGFLELPADREAVSRAVDATRFARLQAQERTAGFVERSRHSALFFRDGSAVGWRRVLTGEQGARIVDAHAVVMRRLGYLGRPDSGDLVDAAAGGARPKAGWTQAPAGLRN